MPTEICTSVWQSRTLAQDEIWQARSAGRAILTTIETPTGSDDLRGIRLELGEVRVFRSEQTVSFRALDGQLRPGETITLHREVHQ